MYANINDVAQGYASGGYVEHVNALLGKGADRDAAARGDTFHGRGSATTPLLSAVSLPPDAAPK